MLQIVVNHCNKVKHNCNFLSLDLFLINLINLQRGKFKRPRFVFFVACTAKTVLGIDEVKFSKYDDDTVLCSYVNPLTVTVLLVFSMKTSYSEKSWCQFRSFIGIKCKKGRA